MGELFRLRKIAVVIEICRFSLVSKPLPVCVNSWKEICWLYTIFRIYGIKNDMDSGITMNAIGRSNEDIVLFE